MSVTQAQVGTIYIPNYNNIPWTQPLGPGTAVLPPQNNGPFTNYPIPGIIFGEAALALWHLGCGHGIDVFRVFRDYDSGTKMSCAVVCCSICSFISSLKEPYEIIFDPNQYPILVS